MTERHAKRRRLGDLGDDGIPDNTGVIQINGETRIDGQSRVQIGHSYHTYNQHFSTAPDNSKTENDDALIKSLLFDRIDARLRNVTKPLSSTCKWLFQHMSFQEWHSAHALHQHNGFLWIKGKPGCGKSTIMKAALERTKKEIHKRKVGEILASYFFNGRAAASLEKSSLGLYRSLVHQLVTQRSSIRDAFLINFATKGCDSSVDPWIGEELQDFLQEIITSSDPLILYVFIDALDEGEHEDDVRQMIKFFVDLSERAVSNDSKCQLRICLSSRHYPHISIGKGLSLVVEAQPEHAQDIDVYIHERLNAAGSNAKDELGTALRKKSASVFLWVVLVVDLLNKMDDDGHKLENMKNRLHTIPSNLNELFTEILAKSPAGIQTSIALFQWLLFAKRQFEPQELYLAVEYSQSPWDSTWSPTENINIVSPERIYRYLLNHSRGLVELSAAQPPIVQFIHETVREFLMSKAGLATLLPSLSVNLSGISHEILKTACLRYILQHPVPQDFYSYRMSRRTVSEQKSLTDTIHKESPLILYAASHLFIHAEEAQKNGLSQKDFLNSRSDEHERWNGQEKEWWNIFERFEIRKYWPDTTLLYFLADQGYINLLSVSLETSGTVNVRCGRYGYALSAACANGAEQIARVLLSKGAKVNNVGGENQTAIINAIMNRKFELVYILQESGALLDPTKIQRALFAMLECGSTEGVSMVLRIGADPHQIDRHNWSVFDRITHRNRDSIVKLLVQHIDFARFSTGNLWVLYKSLLRVADTETLRMTLEKIVDTSNSDLHHLHVLQAASYLGRNHLVRQLIDRGVDVNAQGGFYGTALQAAALAGLNSSHCLELVQMLLEVGADVNAQGGFYGTALQAAVVVSKFYDGSELVQMLLEKGADVNTRGGDFGSALKAAKFFNNTSVIQMLLDWGAHEDIPDFVVREKPAREYART